MKHFLYTFLCALCVLATSCTDLSEVNSRLDALEQTVSDLQSAIKALEQAQADMKTVKEIEPISTGGWAITFTDGSVINVADSEKCITPLLRIDQDGYLTVSYDNGETYSRMQDESGNPIDMRNKSVRVTTDADGRYVFQEYLTSDPQTVTAETATPVSADASVCIRAIAEDSKTHVVTITMGNGQTFTFNKLTVTPTSIAILTTQTVNITKNAEAIVEFRVNPQTALFCYDVDSTACQIQLDRVGRTRADNSYVTKPTSYRLTKVEQVYDDNGVMKQGQYRATIADLGVEQGYDDQVALVINATDGNGDKQLISSSTFRLKYTNSAIVQFTFKSSLNSSVLKDVEGEVYGNEIIVKSPYITSAKSLIPTIGCGGKLYVNGTEQKSGVTQQDFTNDVTYTVSGDDGETATYNVKVLYSGLPIMEINTPNHTPITSKTQWTEGADYKIVNTDGTTNCEGKLKIRGRGNSTWGAVSKKPYAIKFEKKAEPLGMSKEKRFDLLANAMDRTLIRNDVSYKMARLTNTMGWNPTGQYVELVLNGRHIGNYYLCEHVKIGKNRVNIHDMEDDVENSNYSTASQNVSGGYIMEICWRADAAFQFQSPIHNLNYEFKDPDENITDAQMAYMKQYVSDMETSLNDETQFANREFTKYMDLDSYIDWWLVSEITGNREELSIFMHKDRDGKMVAGPVWDYDLYTFMYYTTWIKKTRLYYSRLFNDAAFVARVKEKWAAQKSLYDNLTSYIDTQASMLKASDALNTSIWTMTTRINGDETLTYAAAIDKMKLNLTRRISWLNTNIAAL